ncbi:Mitochondrial carnitine-acylcarnitine carrier protein [Phaffia rhodozyma]|uniref:Mitochondrial carnitine-acylcarnitine carrier protein n=1 Tax=Phaffia rhodozyma TaxID=264483 RepID=A0A0F7SE64_PHARH|nr:Mitochondrial carnitine-acylcarnitine carrier protein [Phaffia rhodozyma]
MAQHTLSPHSTAATVNNPAIAAAAATTTLSTLLSGAPSGITKHLLGFPFDTLKTVLQTSSYQAYSGRFPAIQALRRTVSQHGIPGLYRGGSLPCLAWTATDGMLYSVLWEARRRLFADGHSAWTEPARNGEGRRLNLQGHLVAGSIAGLSVSLFTHPVDVCKVKLQSQLRMTPNSPPFTFNSHQTSSLAISKNKLFTTRLPVVHPPCPPYPLQSQPVRSTGTAPGFGSSSLRLPLRPIFPPKSPVEVKFTSPWDCWSQVVKARGIRGGLYKGFGWTCLMRTGMGGMFCTYEALLRATEPIKVPNPVRTFFSGSIAALMFWTVFLPADVMKSKMLADSHLHPKYPTSAHAIKTVWLEGGKKVSAFWRGGGAVGLRAAGVNGVALLVWEGVMRITGNDTFS